MNKIIETIALELSKQNRTITIPAGSMLSTINPVNVVQHGNVNELDIKISTVLGNELHNIKNNIIPIIQEFGEVVSKSLLNKMNNNPLKDVNIVYAELPEFMEELISRNVINKNAINITLSNNVLSIPRPEVHLIRSMLKYGSGQMEDMIQAFTNSISNDELVRIWDTYLNRITADNTNYVNLGYTVNNGIYGSDLFILSILVKNLKQTVPEGIRVSLGVYNETINILDSLLDAKIVRVDNMITSYGKTGKLIYKADNINSVIVIKETYDVFLNNGGSPEAIYGAVIKGAKSASISTIESKKDEYVEEWNKFVNASTVKQHIATLEQHRLAYRLGINDIMTNFISEDVKASIPEEIVADYGNIVIAYMNKCKHEDLFNINKTVEEIIGNILFGHTNTIEFLRYMKYYSNMDSNISAKEAATYASMDLIIDFLLTQIEIN